MYCYVKQDEAKPQLNFYLFRCDHFLHAYCVELLFLQ